MRKIIFSLATLLALLLAVEIGVTLLSEHGLEKVMRSQYGLPDNLKVSINSFPLAMSLLRNHLGEVQFSWEDELEFMAPTGTKTRAPYYGRVTVYDVELNMPSLLKGRLEIRKISRIKTSIAIDETPINHALGHENNFFIIENGRVYKLSDGNKIQYKVKVLGDYSLYVEPVNGSTSGEGSPQYPQSEVQVPQLVIEIDALPFGAKLESVSPEGDRLIFVISIPMWEGYL